MVWFVRSVCPSVSGWYEELNCSRVPNCCHRFRQKLLVNFVSRSLMIAVGIPCSRTTVEMKSRAVSSAVIDFLHAAKCAIFVSRSTTTRIASFPLVPAGNPVTKSIVTYCQARSGGGIGCNCLAGHFRDDFMIWQVGHDATCRCTSINISGQ
ncbi:unnamed protein product [Closterium sp. NIES-54]